MMNSNKGLGSALMVTGLVAASLCGRAIAAPVIAGASLSGTQPVLVHSVLVFPTAPDEGDTGESFHVAKKLDQAIQFRLNTIGHLKVTYFSRHLSSVERAVDQDKSLSEPQVTPPFDDTAKAGPVAAIIDTDAYLVDRVESYTYDDATKKVTIEVSANMYNTETGDGIAGIAVTGTGVGISNSDEQISITQYAINDAASQIVREVNDAAAPVPTSRHGSQIGSATKGKSFLLAVLASAALFAAFNHGSGGSHTTTVAGTSTGSSGSGPGTPPSPGFVK